MSALAKRAKMGRWSSVPWFSAFPAVVAVPKAREGGTHSTQAAPNSSAPGTTRSALWTTGPWAIAFHRLCARAREESDTGWWSSVPWFSAFPAVATVPKAREGGAHSTQAAPSSSVSAQPAFGGGTPRPFALFGWVVWHRGPLVPKFERLSAPLPRHLFNSNIIVAFLLWSCMFLSDPSRS